jgi:transketolase
LTTIRSAEVPSAGAARGRTLDQLCINTIRTLAMDAVQQANSGHPGTPMALAPVVYTLWQSFLRFDPDDATWPNRDRFVLSNGHASMLLYAMLHLSGVKSGDTRRELGGDARRYQAVPTAGQQMPRTSRISRLSVHMRS